jgi:hypothetical protein
LARFALICAFSVYKLYQLLRKRESHSAPGWSALYFATLKGALQAQAFQSLVNTGFLAADVARPARQAFVARVQAHFAALKIAGEAN